ncbi:MAG: FHA domain-containing protein [Myxococcota bacterium]
MPTLVIKNPDGSQQEQDVAEQLTIGRADGNDLILSEGGVSRKHARFFLEGEDFMVEDSGSANGTWVDGEKIEGPTKLSSKSQVVIGDYEIMLKLGSKPLPKANKAAAKPSREPTAATGRAIKPAPRSTKVVSAVKPSGSSAALAKRPGPQRAAGPQLRGLTGGVTGKTFALSGTMTVGRVAGVDVQIDDDSVSRRHAELVVDGREVTVRDLGSANGTTVNGAPISEDTILAAGDIVQFGVVEVMFETGPGSGSRAPIARPSRDAPSRPVRPSRAPPPDVAGLDTETRGGKPPMDPKKKMLLFGGGGLVVLLFILVLVKALTAPPEPIEGPTALAGTPRTPKGKAPPVEDDPATAIEEMLAACRTYSSSEQGAPDWAAALASCNKVLELEPIHAEANSLIKRISVLKVCEENVNKAKELLAAGAQEEALEWYAKLGKDCESYLLRTLAAAKEPVAEVKKKAAADCKLYATNARWEFAYKRCELYSRLACQTMDDKELYPPALMKLKLDGPLNPKTDWRPSDTLYINFLKAREKMKPGEPPWRCPEIPAFRPPPPPPDPTRLAKEELAKRYPEPEMGRALVLYFEGKFPEAPVPLQKLGEKVEKAQYHEAARALLLDINNAINLYENGTAEINNEKLDKAEVSFSKALVVDEKLVLGDKAAKLTADEKKRELEKRASFVRKNVVDTMGRTCYERGKSLADRKDFRAACKVWKIGLTFNRAHIDLLRAASNVCTARAKEAWERAETCAQLQQVLDFAVDGDGFKEKVADQMQQNECN